MGNGGGHSVSGRLGRLSWALALAVWLVAVTALYSRPAAAHTDFDSSVPADGDEVSEPVDEVVVTFTGPVEPTGEGFVVLDPAGGIRQPDEVAAAGDAQWSLRFDPPLVGGTATIRWTMQAPDGHAISGGISFLVTAESRPDSEPEADSEAEPTNGATVEGSTLSPPDTGSSADAPSLGGATGLQPDSTTDRGDTGNELTSEPVEPLSGRPGNDQPADSAEITLGDWLPPVNSSSFVDAGTERLEDARLVATVGRGVGYGGTIMAIGALVFAAFVLDRRSDILTMMHWVALCGLIVIGGACIEIGAWTFLDRGHWTVSSLLATVNTQQGYSVVLRAMGGALVWAMPTPILRIRTGVGTRPVSAAGGPPTMTDSETALPGDESTPNSAVATKSAVRTAPVPVGNDPDVVPVSWRWGPGAAVAVVGSVLLAVSHVFDGHTVSTGNRIVISLAALSHVGAAATWAGGVVALALTMRFRRRRRSPVAGAELGARFSVVAAGGLVVAGITGVALTAMILDTPGQLWTTDWGRLLLVKVALVAAGAGLGAFNHSVLIPRLMVEAGRPTSRRLGPVVAIEAVLLAVVAVLAGVLVGAAL